MQDNSAERRLNELEHSLFNVVNVEEKLHFTWRMTKLRNVSLEIFLDLRSEIAKTQTTHFVVSFDDCALILLRCVFSNPAINLFVAGAGRNELFELHCIQAGELPKVSA
jgi:hypothetical protein